MPSISKLTEEQWAKVVAYYEDGHTLNECVVISGLARQSISRQLKLRGVTLRAAYQPATPAAAARLRNPVLKAKYAPPQESVAPEGGVTPPKRKIIGGNKNYERSV
jgi:hypothetical protein